jgi:uncharacterized membrane protein
MKNNYKQMKRLIPFTLIFIGLTIKAFPQDKQSIVPMPGYQNGDIKTASLYKMGLHISSKYFGGLMYVKPINNNKISIVFISELGLKYFKFTLDVKNDSIHTDYVMEFLNRKSLIKLLKSDIKLLFAHHNIIREKECGKNAVKIKTDQGKYKKITEADNEIVIKELGFLFNKRKISIIDDKISVKHNSIIRLKFKLRFLKHI